MKSGVFKPFAVIAICGSAVAAELPPAVNRPVDFVRDVQPILSSRCYECHGEKKQKAELRWDVKSVALKGGEQGAPLAPGKSADSLIIQMVAGLKGEESRMPPKGEPLTDEQVGILRAWIDQGADWPEEASVKLSDPRSHWAFKAPVRPTAPDVQSSKSKSQSPIDAFVIDRLDKEGLKLSAEADRVTLIRRLKLDLIGLPTTPAEVDDFVSDTSNDAYEKLVEKFLASPHYGERWGRHWLDAARYADSNGFEKDAPRSIWPYRDWVINAVNRDLPFDQFTIEQLAGDLLPNATLDQKVATGFLRNSMQNQEGGIEPEQFRTEAMIDRIDAVGRAWLGLTIACAQCHNHKFDPISHREYFQLYAFLNNDNEPFLEVPTPKEQKQRDELTAKVRALEDKAMKDATNLTERMAAWEKEAADAAGNWFVLDPTEWHNFATKYEKQSDGSLLGGGDVQLGAVTRVWVDATPANITGLRLEVLKHPNLPYEGPGLMKTGSWLLKEFVCEAYALTNATVTNKIKFRRALASAEASGFAITNAIDGQTAKGGWTASTFPVLKNAEHRAVFECAEEIPEFPGGTRLQFTIYQKFESGDAKDTGLDCHTFGRFRLSATTNAAPLKADPFATEQRKSFAIAPEKRTPDQQRELFNVFRRQDALFSNINAKIDGQWTNWIYVPTTLALSQRTEPRHTRVFKRGDWQRLGDEVTAEVPKILPPLPDDAPRNRLSFARWIVDRRAPTTARVIVNRVWQAYFGQGLFTTPEDIGTRCEIPSHPELLDWLAVEFMEPTTKVKGPMSNVQGKPWSLKHLHRLIVTAATYKQSSRVTPELLAKDAYNVLLARGPRFRVESEIVQDIALSASGLLNGKIGGPSVRPPIPASVGDTVYGGFSWPESSGEERYRRGMYTFWKRALPFPSMVAFDAPTADASCTRRVRSNTPLQALTTLNEKTFVEAAQGMGLRVYREGGKDDRSRAT
ncbi:MAG TPA: PSD1 and planctomycete cytochrome C domain-containing protein, partial [Methylomirabilota bacterium]|nr:PSD1 and planctomycete cytochrome C domain-containing protein [Methylomirabilota bacterium]